MFRNHQFLLFPHFTSALIVCICQMQRNHVTKHPTFHGCRAETYADGCLPRSFIVKLPDLHETPEIVFFRLHVCTGSKLIKRLESNEPFQCEHAFICSACLFKKKQNCQCLFSGRQERERERLKREGMDKAKHESP